jgi:heat shock protein HtpX
MNAWTLRLSMAATLAIIFGLTTLVFTAVLFAAGLGFSILGLELIAILVLGMNIVQWLIAPYLIGAIYKVKALAQNEKPELHQMVENISRKSGISAPKLMLAQIPLPNAFAYGSPLTGNRIAVTQGLLDNLDSGEVEAVIGHELGHVKHHDVQLMMVVSFLPALFAYIGYTVMLSGMLGGGSGNGKQGNSGYNALIGIFFIAFSYVLTLFTLYLSRLREYFADRHSASVVENGAEKLSTGLVTIVEISKNSSRRGNKQQKGNNSFKALFIADPDRAAADAAEMGGKYVYDKKDLLQQALSKKPSKSDNFAEIFSTHPNMIKRLHALQEINSKS